MSRILVIHGPNLNMLGVRETDIYGDMTLDKINDELTGLAGELGVEVGFFQSNHEGEIVTRIQEAHGKVDVLIINPGAYTHTSVAIRDAISAVQLPTVEVHLSNIYKREDFRHRSHISGVAVGQIAGFGPDSYMLAMRAAAKICKS
jgi:3-dehydroquinate dehydratase II